MMAAYATVEGEAQAEIVEKKSRFIAHLAHAGTEEEALAFLARVRTEHAQARHNVYAYLIRGAAPGAPERIRYSDDGEPGGTSGMPTLQVLQHAGLADVVCVTTRYFGGTLLGTGGLVRAYTQAASAAVEAARIVTMARVVDVRVHVGYALYEPALRLAESCGAHLAASDFADDVALVFRMGEHEEGPLVAGLRELTRGQAGIDVSEAFEAAL